jgi:hypothetical protein
LADENGAGDTIASREDGQSMKVDEDEESERHACVDCGMLSPKTDTNYTLISARYGWRLSRAVDAAGHAIMEWRCPRCWEKYRRRSVK